VIVEAPVNGVDAAHVRYNAWQFRQILGRGVRHSALPGGNRRRGACLRGILPLSAQHDRRRSENPLADGTDGGAIRARDGGTDSAGRKMLGIGAGRIGDHGGAVGLSIEEYWRCDRPLNRR
jgi:4-hydroxy-2-oxoheptanedioate aldolase